MAKVDNVPNSESDLITIVKSEPYDQDMGDTNESIFYCVTESSDCSSSQPFDMKQETDCIGNTSCSKRMYKCEQCGHLNRITLALEDGFIDSSQSIGNSQTTSVYQVSINPSSMELNSQPFPSQTNNSLCDNQKRSPEFETDNSTVKKRKRLAFLGDVGDDEELEGEAAQKYISVLRKSVIEHRKQTRILMQQNRRQQQRIDKLKSMLKELIEKTKNGNYIIEAS